MKYVPLLLALVSSSSYASRDLPSLLHRLKNRTVAKANITVVTDKLLRSVGVGAAAVFILCSNLGCSLSESGNSARTASQEHSGSERASMSDAERAKERERARQRERRRRERLGERYEQRYGDSKYEGEYQGEAYRLRSGDELASEKLGDLSAPIRFSASSRRYRVGEYVYFVHDSVAYSGTVLSDLGKYKYAINIDSAGYARSTAAVSGHDIIAAYKPNEDEKRLEGESVLVAGDGRRVKYRNGTIVRFYDDGYVEIRVNSETHNDGLQIMLKRPYIIFVDGSLPLAEGGFDMGSSF